MARSLTRRVLDRMPDRVTSGVDMMRGLVSGTNLLGQLDKLRLLVRFRREHDELRTALMYYRYTMAILFALRLDLFEAITDGSTTAQVARRAGTTQRAAEMLLRILEAQGHVERTGTNGALTWRVTEFARHFVAPGGELSYASLIDLVGTFSESTDQIVDGLRTGKIPDSLDIFSDAARVDAFLDAVNSYLDSAARELLLKVDLPEIRTFICGSMGVSFSALVLHYFSDSRVTYGCLDHLVERIPRLREEFGVDPSRVDGTHCHGGEPGEDRWGSESYDLVFLTKKMVLEPEQRLGWKFAAKAFDVLNRGGVAIFWEAVHHDDRPTPMKLAMESVLDIGVSPTGCVLTRDTMTKMLCEIGYETVEFVPCLGGETNFVVARR